MPNNIHPGYVMQVGDKQLIIWDSVGPSSYNNTGTYSTSGVPVNAIDLGEGGFDAVWECGDSSNGLYYGVIVPTAGGSGNAVKSFQLHWFVRATGAEVANGTNLSGSALTLAAIVV